MRHLILVLGDQLDGRSSAFDGFDRDQDAILQIEAREEAAYIPQHRMRLTAFFSAMRHFGQEQMALGRRVVYVTLDDPENEGTLASELSRQAGLLEPNRIFVVEPSDWRVRDALGALDLPLEMRSDRHFLCSRGEFAHFIEAHPRPILETFYRAMRKRTGFLMEADGKPAGGAWNFDHDNRKAFARGQRPLIAPPPRFAPDKITREVMAMVARRFPQGPGRLEGFGLPVTREHAIVVLDDFVRHRLADFGRYQDAMLGGEPFLYHSELSLPLNLHLITPEEAVRRVLEHSKGAPLNSVEGFVRQVIGWREFVRGIYWRLMPEYADRNELAADLPVPRFYWTGETDMRCLAEAIGHTIDHAYAHHIERLMVLGLFCLLLGVRPYDVHRWHMSMFRDAVDWVSLPNTLGMSQHADGGVVGTKPYAASGAYINRMSDHCRHCRYDPAKATGDDACPFTTLYWDFLARHEERFAGNARMRNMYVNLDKKRGELKAIRRQADEVKALATAEAFL